MRPIAPIFFISAALLCVGPGLARANTSDLLGEVVIDVDNRNPRAMSYRDDAVPPRLYIVDFGRESVFEYDVSGSVLTTRSETAGFADIRGIAYCAPYMYLLYSAPAAGSGWDSAVGRVDLSTDPLASPPVAERIDLSGVGSFISGLEAYRLACDQQAIYVSYDTSGFATREEQVTRGHLALKVSGSHWGAAVAGSPTGFVRDLPNSGRWLGGTRAQTWGMAPMDAGGSSYLWATSGEDKVYLAERSTSRGIFSFEVPGRLMGLAVVGDELWASTSTPDFNVYRIDMGVDDDTPVTSRRHVRHISFELKNKVESSFASGKLYHLFAEAPSGSKRPSQSKWVSSYQLTSTPALPQGGYFYDPGGDTSMRQWYRHATYNGAGTAGDEFTSIFEFDALSTDRRHFVFPHRVNALGSLGGDYLGDDADLYQFATETGEYNTFIAAAKTEMAVRYGTALNGRYWDLRNLMEYILLRYDYGDSADIPALEYKYNPAPPKLDRASLPNLADREMTCSPASTAMAGLARWQGIPARWIGMTQQTDWDSDGDGFFAVGDTSGLGAYHRFTELWLGSNYGWQDFDATPFEHLNGDPAPQWLLMERVAQGPTERRLVMNTGSGAVLQFFDQKDNNQRYNALGRFTNPDDWSHVELRDGDGNKRPISVWSNPLGLQVDTFTFPSGLVSMTWTAVGPWATLANAATVDLYLDRVDPSTEAVLGSQLQASGLSWNSGSYSGAPAGSMVSGAEYRVRIEKSDDAQTGTRSSWGRTW